MSDIYLPIWPGSSSFFPGDTPYGFYDNDSAFQIDIEATAEWCARRLGYGLSDVELQDKHFFANFEEAVSEYGRLINTYAARDNMMGLVGNSTGSNINLSQTYIQPSFAQIFEISKEYGNHIGIGGTQTWFTGSLQMIDGQQVYDLRSATLETGSFVTDKFTIRRILHDRTPASLRYMSETWGNESAASSFGWGFMGQSYLMLPLNYDVYAIQAVEFNDEVRKSEYSFQLTNNRIRIFPIPQESFNLYFHYTLDNLDSSLNGSGTTGKDKISDLSNIPYSNLTYGKINGIGRQWIRKYALALSKETLGYIRGKYSAIPIADGEVTLNAQDLLTAGKEEKDALIEDLKETLDQMSKQSQLERKAAEATALNDQLGWFPNKFYWR